MSPLIQSQRSLLAPAWAGYPSALWRRAKAIPSLDLRFAENKSLVDATTGQNLITFTRASSGTYVDSQGVIRTATTNLLLRSEEFNDAVWGKVGGSLTTNAIAAPDGQTTADLFTEDTGTGQHDVRVTSPTLADATTYTFSVYARTNGRQLQIIYPLNTSGHGAVFNLSNGTFTLVGNTVSASIAFVGNGWYRCTCTSTKAGGSGTSTIRLLTNNGTTNNYTGDGTSGIYLWGAQLEQSSTVGEYIPTTGTINSAPRFDHNPTTGESLGLLVEEQRTNLITTSEALANVTGASITNNTTTAPDGLTTADTLTEDTSTGAHSVNTASITWVGNTVYTFTIFLKANTRNQVNLAFGTSSNWVNGQRSAVFDLSTGTVASSPSSPVVASIEAYPNGWYRCRLTATTVASPVPSTTQIQMYVSGSSSYTGNGTSGLFFWGAQLEAAAFSTSYIPTSGATVTRSADVASITGTNFSSWYRQDEGTVFAEGAVPVGVSGARVIASIDDGTTAERIQIGHNGTTAIQNLVVDGSSVQFSPTVVGASFPPGEYRKLAMAIKAADFAAITAPGTLATGGTGTMPTPTQLQIGFGPSRTQPNLPIKRLTYFPIRLANEVLQRITQ